MRGVLPQAVTTSFLALISKYVSPLSVDEFRPICLVGCLYHLISKLLDGRLRLVIGKLISKSQMDFIEGMPFFDGALILNEVLDFAKRMRRKCMILKVDLEKAYDYVS